MRMWCEWWKLAGVRPDQRRRHPVCLACDSSAMQDTYQPTEGKAVSPCSDPAAMCASTFGSGAYDTFHRSSPSAGFMLWAALVPSV